MPGCGQCNPGKKTLVIMYGEYNMLFLLTLLSIGFILTSALEEIWCTLEAPCETFSHCGSFHVAEGVVPSLLLSLSRVLKEKSSPDFLNLNGKHDEFMKRRGGRAVRAHTTWGPEKQVTTSALLQSDHLLHVSPLPSTNFLSLFAVSFKILHGRKN